MSSTDIESLSAIALLDPKTGAADRDDVPHGPSPREDWKKNDPFSHVVLGLRNRQPTRAFVIFFTNRRNRKTIG